MITEQQFWKRATTMKIGTIGITVATHLVEADEIAIYPWSCLCLEVPIVQGLLSISKMDFDQRRR